MNQKNCNTELCHQVADAAVAKTFAILGVDIKSPSEVEEFRKSLRFGDTMRKYVERGMASAVVAVFLMLVSAIGAGVVTLLHKGGTH